ncbi:uncharacterized protein BDZ99DRAFT_364317, partial [Mytilinidion resinicola]
ESDQLARDLTGKFRSILSIKRMDQLAARGAASRARTPPTLSASSRSIQSPPSYSSFRNAPSIPPPPSYSSLRNIPLVPQPPQDARSFRFRDLLHSLSNIPLRWEDSVLLDKALEVVPLEHIYDEAEQESQILQMEAESLGPGKRAAWDYQDCVIRALLRWFKRSFFTWVNNPHCTSCGGPTIGRGMAEPTANERALAATEVELYQCPACHNYERYARYSNAFTLLRTRRGRVGEWTNCFGMLCRALGSRVRWVWNSEDHVWTEVYSLHQKRWIHVDACEEAWDKPRLYTEGKLTTHKFIGWGRKLRYCIAFSVDGATDVTRRYVGNPIRHGLERTGAPESCLLHILDEINAMRRGKDTPEYRFKIEGEDLREQRELRHYVISTLV